MAQMTSKDAVAAIHQATAAELKDMKTAHALYGKSKPLLVRSADNLEAELKKGESGDFMQATIATMAQPMTDMARALAILSRAVKAVGAFLKANPDVAAAVPKEFLADFREGVDGQERMRNLLRRAKELKDKAEAFIDRQGRDSDAAGEDWAAAMAEFEGLCRRADDDMRQLTIWEKSARTAADSRDHASLERLRKAPPSCGALAAIAAMPSGKPFRDFDRTYEIDALSAELRDEIRRDRAKAMAAFERVFKLVAARDAALRRVAAMAVDERDVAKALKVLALPKPALAKLKDALDLPEAMRVRALDGVAKLFKSDQSGQEMVLALRKAAVI